VKGVFGLFRLAFRLFAVAILASGIAAADTIVATGVDPSFGEYNLWIDQQGTDVNTYFAGVIDIQLVNSGGNTFNRYTMCVDLFTDIYLGNSYNTVVELPSQVSPPQSPAFLERVAWLEDNALLPVMTPGDPSLLPSIDWASTPTQAAGLQLAIWDITVDGGDGFLSGEVQAATGANLTDPATLAWAETYEAVSVGLSSNAAFVYENLGAQTLEGPEYQDNGPSPTPESPTMLLAGAALLALGHAARRRLGSH
jgi:hypothetical protein